MKSAFLRLCTFSILLLGAPMLQAQPAQMRAATKERMDQLEKELRDRLQAVRSNEKEIAKLRDEAKELITAEQAERQVKEKQAALYRDAIEAAPDAWRASTGGSAPDVAKAGEKVRQLAMDAMSVNEPLFDFYDAELRRRQINVLIGELKAKNTQLEQQIILALVVSGAVAATTQEAAMKLASSARKADLAVGRMISRGEKVAADRTSAREAAARATPKETDPRGGDRQRDRDVREAKQKEPTRKEPTQKEPKPREPRERREPEVRIP